MLLSELPTFFETTRAFKSLSPESKRSYSRHLRKLLTFLPPDTPLDTIKAETVDSLYLDVEKKLGTHAAVTICRIARRGLNVAKRYEHTSSNPFEKMGLPSLPPREIMPSREELNDFSVGCERIGRRSLGLLAELCYVFCQRPIDMRMLKWEAYDGATLTHMQQKTGTIMLHHVPGYMQDILNAQKRVSPYIIVREDTLQPYSKDDYPKIVDKVRTLMSLPDTFQLRDLRRMGLTEAGDHEATDQEIDALSGHLSPAMRGVYTRRTLKQSKSAMTKRFA